MRLAILTCVLLAGCSESHPGPDDLDAGVRRDGQSPAPDDASIGTDAGPIVTPPGTIVCGDTVCTVGTETCAASCVDPSGAYVPACLTLDADGNWPVEECPGGTEQFPRHLLFCDGTEDCPSGELCHILYGSLGQYARCDACVDCDLTWFNVLCRSNADCPAAVPLCAPTDALRGYSVCVVPD